MASAASWRSTNPTPDALGVANCCIGTIKKSATYEISGAVERHAVAIRELVENKRQPLKKKLSAKNSPQGSYIRDPRLIRSWSSLA
jgi:hypothetical protein